MTKTLSRALLVAGMFLAVVGYFSKDSTAQAQAAGAGGAAKPKERVLDLGNKVTLKLVQIPAGKFTMGSPKDEKDRDDKEVQHEVTISQPFYLGVTEVTQEQYEAVMGKNPSNFKGPTNPVENVSWDDAVEFCKKVSEKTGKKVVLPTEAQWEYACRAGSKTRFSFDDKDTDLDDYAWYWGNSMDKDKGQRMTHPVGQKKPNAWGLYDMHGTVWEWCQDWYGDYKEGAATDPTGADTGSFRVLRGGSWANAPRLCRSAYRYWFNPVIPHGYFGFRVAVVAAGVDLP